MRQRRIDILDHCSVATMERNTCHTNAITLKGVAHSFQVLFYSMSSRPCTKIEVAYSSTEFLRYPAGAHITARIDKHRLAGERIGMISILPILAIRVGVLHSFLSTRPT